MISSTHNSRIQWVRALQARARERRQEGAFVVEGVRLVEEALASEWETILVLYTEEAGARALAAARAFAGRCVTVETVTPAVMAACSDTDTPQGILAVLRWQNLPLPERLDFILIADGVRDPGNLGTILRTAAAAGASAVILPPGAVDPFSPKVLRAAMGAHFRLPVHNLDWPAIQALALRHILRLYLAAAGAGLAYTQCDFRAPLALVIGGEARGAGLEVQSLAHTPLHIPMPGGMESLNAAVAAAILLFEVVRQRHSTPSGAAGGPDLENGPADRERSG